MRHNLPGQCELPETGERIAETTQRKADAPMRPQYPQKPCDIGLFSDDANQLDLIEMLMD